MFLVNNVGTLCTFCPLTLRAKEWIDELVEDDAQWFGHALVVEPRYAWGLAQGMQDDGTKECSEPAFFKAVAKADLRVWVMNKLSSRSPMLSRGCKINPG